MKKCGVIGAILVVWALTGMSSTLYASERIPVWVYFDRRDSSELAKERASKNLDLKAEARRIRAMGKSTLEIDLPVHPNDRKVLEATGAEIRTESRWLNAVSAWATPSQIALIKSLPHVRRVATVQRGTAERPSETFLSLASKLKNSRSTSVIDTSAYGYGWIQANLVDVPRVHELGYDGSGVRIAFLDDGFRGYDEHIAFQHTSIVATYNTHDQSSVVTETGSHGTRVISTVVSSDTSRMIGIAPGAEVLLIRTEDSSSEYPAEEDYWIAGLEWAESHGADLVSSSLSYLDWYEAEDFDGNTAAITIAADQAAAMGLLVVTSAGNEGANGVAAPADGDSVLSVGATTYTGAYASFSSIGPTADGRLKPEISAMGQQTVLVDPNTTNGYQYGNGTSFSCPTVAGIVALMLDANPDLLPMEIVSMITSTGTLADEPNNYLGHGVAQAYDAVQLALAAVDAPETDVPASVTSASVSIYPNPTNGLSVVSFETPDAGDVRVWLHDVLGRTVWQSKQRVAQAGTVRISANLDALSSGIYFVSVQQSSTRVTKKIILVR